ncbi:MAG TPA: DUF4389 domain-containing protein [Acidimicrobiales bacterium]
MEPEPRPAPAYPATFAVDTPESITNWRPLVQWLLAIPHFIVLYALGVLSQVVAVIAWFVILFTGKLPEGLAGVQHLYVRYANRTYAYAGFLREEYPPFAFDTTADDPGDYALVRTAFTPAYEDRNRLTVAFRFILVIPHAIVLGVLAFVAYLLVLVNVFVVLFTGSWSAGMRDFVVGTLRWATRLNAYQLLLTDEYPPFSLD